MLELHTQGVRKRWYRQLKEIKNIMKFLHKDLKSSMAWGAALSQMS